jgi:hypothetical protein
LTFVLFPNAMLGGLRDGSITVTFRDWKRPQAKVGGRHRTAAGDLVVDVSDRVAAGQITDADARKAGFADAAELLRDRKWSAETVVYRIGFHREDSTLRPVPDLDDDAISARLDRLDQLGAGGPWTRATLDIIRRRPAVRAGDLAAELGRERLPFKADVRKLKALGLTESLDVGYRLSPRGRAYLDRE